MFVPSPPLNLASHCEVTVVGLYKAYWSWCRRIIRSRLHPRNPPRRRRGVYCASQVYSCNCNEMVLMTSHLLAYTISTTAPQPHRLAALPFRIQIPNLIPSRVYNSEFLREMRSTETVKLIARIWRRIVTWSRRTFIGDRVLPSPHPSFSPLLFSPFPAT